MIYTWQHMYLRNTNRLQHDEEYDIYFHIHIQVKLAAICFEKLHFSLKAFYCVINKRHNHFYLILYAFAININISWI